MYFFKVDNQKGTSSVGNFILLKTEFAWMHEKKKIEGWLAADQWKKNHTMISDPRVILDPLKVSKFQNEFMKSSFLQKYGQKKFRSYFGRNDDFIDSVWNFLTCSMDVWQISRKTEMTSLKKQICFFRKDFYWVTHFTLIEV